MIDGAGMCDLDHVERHKMEAGDIQMLYKKVTVEVVVPADEAEAIVAELNSSLDQLDEKYTLFGGEIEAIAFEGRATRRRSALAHTIAAGDSVVGALRTARASVAVALRAVV
jgi:molybdopterin converting factor small subunit